MTRGSRYARRHRALRSAVTGFCPLGFHATWDYIELRAGRLRGDAAALVRALGVLETARDARLREAAEYERRRTAEKRTQRVPDDTLDRLPWRWPGPDGHDAMYFTAEVLWAERTQPFPEGLPPRGELALRVLQRHVLVCLSGYFEQDGRLLDRDRGTLRAALGELRAVVGFPRTYPAAFAHFWPLLKLATIVAQDSRRARTAGSCPSTESSCTRRRSGPRATGASITGTTSRTAPRTRRPASSPICVRPTRSTCGRPAADGARRTRSSGARGTGRTSGS
ncbi:MAG: hypothetical protein GEV11_24245 [Streptosporangiales bacterium]|nr:hypothetical protein [Streptosporangiales bacterium]